MPECPIVRELRSTGQFEVFVGVPDNAEDINPVVR